MKIFSRRRIVILILGFVVFQGLYILGLIYLGKTDTFLSSFSSVFAEKEKKQIEILMIQYGNSTYDNKYRLNLEGFIDATDSFPDFNVTVVEGVGNNLLILSDIIEKANVRGVKNIFLFGFPYGLEIENIFRTYKDVSFYYYNGNATSGNVRNYGVSIFMEKYYLGMLAGMQTLTNNIGYISDFPFVEHMRSLNYFARGVEYVNPEAKINVVWTGKSFDRDAVSQSVEKLQNDMHVDVITGSMIACLWCDKSEELGVPFIGQHTDLQDKYQYYLSSYELDYHKVYLRLFSMINSTFDGFGEDITWFDETDGAVRISTFSSRISHETARRIWLRRSQLISCDDYVFRGPVYANDGQMVAPANSLITDKLLSDRVLSMYRNIKENILTESGDIVSRWIEQEDLFVLPKDISFYDLDFKQQANIQLLEMNKADCKKHLASLSAPRINE